MMLLKTIKDNQVYCYISEGFSKSVICITFFNGFSFEQPSQYGIVYALDSYLYNEIAELLPPESEIKAHTYYAYSEFIITCKSYEIRQILHTILAFLINFKIDQSYFTTLLIKQLEQTHSSAQSIDDLFDGSDYNWERFNQPILGSEDTVKRLTVNDVFHWYQKHYLKSVYFFIVSSESAFSDLSELSLLSTPCNIPLTKFIKKKKPNICFYDYNWDISDIVFAFDYDQHGYQKMLSAELLCYMIETKLKSILSQYGCTGDPPALDILLDNSRLIFRYSVSQNKLENFLKDIWNNLFSNHTFSKIEFANAKETIWRKYDLLFHDPVEIAKFFAWNHSIGNIYSFQTLQELQNEINSIAFSDLPFDCIKADRFSLSICCQKNHQKPIRNLIKEMEHHVTQGILME